MEIKIRYSTIDHHRETRRFKTLAGARKFAQHYLGEHPDIGSFYAVSDDGVGKVTCSGCTLAELFPSETLRSVSTMTDEQFDTYADECEREWRVRTGYRNGYGDLI